MIELETRVSRVEGRKGMSVARATAHPGIGTPSPACPACRPAHAVHIPLFAKGPIGFRIFCGIRPHCHIPATLVAPTAMTVTTESAACQFMQFARSEKPENADPSSRKEYVGLERRRICGTSGTQVLFGQSGQSSQGVGRNGKVLCLHDQPAVGLRTLALAQDARLPAPVMPPAPASVYRLTLEDAQRLALANNTGLILGRLGVQEKSIAIDAASRDYFPKLLGNFYYFHFNDNLGKVATFRTGKLGRLAAGEPDNRRRCHESRQHSHGDHARSAHHKTHRRQRGRPACSRPTRRLPRRQLDKGTSDLLSGGGTSLSRDVRRQTHRSCARPPGASRRATRADQLES